MADRTACATHPELPGCQQSPHRRVRAFQSWRDIDPVHTKYPRRVQARYSVIERIAYTDVAVEVVERVTTSPLSTSAPFSASFFSQKNVLDAIVARVPTAAKKQMEEIYRRGNGLNQESP
jgi:hypothetical protein